MPCKRGSTADALQIQDMKTQLIHEIAFKIQAHQKCICSAKVD